MKEKPKKHHPMKGIIMSSQKEIERRVIPYLKGVSSSLRDLPLRERERIIGHMESHIFEALKTIPLEELKRRRSKRRA